MAKIKGALHSDSAGGAFAKQMIFRHGKKGSVVTSYYKPGSARKIIISEAQLAQREFYGQAVQAWRALTVEEKAIFNKNAKALAKPITGWNLFFKQFETPIIPILYYHLDDNSADKIIVDSKGLKNGASNRNTNLLSVPALINRGINNPLTTDVITLGDCRAFFTDKASFNVWSKRSIFPTSVAACGFVRLGQASTDTYYPNLDHTLRLGIFRTSHVTVPDTGLDYTSLNMLTITSEPGVGGYKVYQNGQLVFSATGQSIIAPNSIWRLLRSESTARFVGYFDEASFFNRVLTLREIQRMYNNGDGLLLS